MIKKGAKMKAALVGVLFFFTMVVGGCNLVKMNPEASKKQTVAKVKEEKITKQDFDYFLVFNKIWGKLQGMEFPQEEKQLAQINESMLDNLVDREQMVQLAKKEKVPVDEKRIDEEAKQIIEVFQENLGGKEEFSKELKENKVTKEEFNDFITKLLEKDLYIEGLYDKVTKDIKVSDQEIVKYYEENKNQFNPSTAKAKHILAETKAKAQEIEKKAKGSKDFDALIKEYNEKEGIKEAADLGEFPYGKMVPKFSEVVFKMEPGAISAPIETEFGFHIVKLEEKDEKPVQKLEEVKEDIAAFLEQTAKEEAFGKYIAENKEKITVKKYPERL